MTDKLTLIDRIVITCRREFAVSVPMCRRADAGAVVGLKRCQSPIVGHWGRMERRLRESL
jgi:hypothetical protein